MAAYDGFFQNELSTGANHFKKLFQEITGEAVTHSQNPLLNLNIWSQSSRFALNKPLLILLALGLLSQGKRDIDFANIEEQLKGLLREFGNNVRRPRSDYPFWRLQNDGIWNVTPNDLKTNSSGDVSALSLRRSQATGRFSDNVQNWLLVEKKRLTVATQQVLETYFAESLHQDLLTAVGFVAAEETVTRQKRDPEFRAAVLSAYRLRCAVCAQDVRIGSITVALEAAHIKWHQAGGPDIVSNGLCLCSTHHKLFDLGAFTINEENKLLVSEHMTGSDQLQEILLRFHDHEIASPNRQEHFPDRHYLRWHREFRFKELPLPLRKTA